MAADRTATLVLTVLLAGCGGGPEPAAADGSARGRCPGQVPALPDRGTAERRALLAQGDAEAGGRARELGLGPDEALATKDVNADPDGSRSVRYDRYARCQEVVGGDLIVHLRPDGGLRDVTWGAAGGRLVLPDPDPAVPADRAAAEAARTSGYRPADTGTPEPVLLAADGPVAVLAWRVRVTETGGARSGEEVLVDARTGRVLRREPLQVS